MSSSIKFIHGKKKTRGELRLPSLHFIACDDWMKKLGKDAFCAWLEFYTWADRSQSNREVDMIPNSMNGIAKRLGVGKEKFYQKIIRPLWNYGFIDFQDIYIESNLKENPVNIIVYEYPQNEMSLATQPLEQIRDYDRDYKPQERKEKSEQAKSPSSKIEPEPSSKIEPEPSSKIEPEPSSKIELNNDKENNVLNNEMNIMSVIQSKAILEWIKSTKLPNRLTDIEHVYLAVKSEPGYSDSLFISTLNKAIKAKISVPFDQYFLKAMVNNMKEQEQVKTIKSKDLPEYIIRQLETKHGESISKLDPIRKKEALDLLFQLNEIDEDTYLKKLKELE